MTDTTNFDDAASSSGGRGFADALGSFKEPLHAWLGAGKELSGLVGELTGQLKAKVAASADEDKTSAPADTSGGTGDATRDAAAAFSAAAHRSTAANPAADGVDAAGWKEAASQAGRSLKDAAEQLRGVKSAEEAKQTLSGFAAKAEAIIKDAAASVKDAAETTKDSQTAASTRSAFTEALDSTRVAFDEAITSLYNSSDSAASVIDKVRVTVDDLSHKAQAVRDSSQAGQRPDITDDPNIIDGEVVDDPEAENR